MKFENVFPIIKYKNDVWSVIPFHNAVCKINNENFSIDMVDIFDLNIENGSIVCADIYGYEDELYFVSSFLDKLFIYDIKNRSVKCINIDQALNNKPKPKKINGSILLNGKLFLFPETAEDDLIIFDIVAKTFQAEKGFTDILKKNNIKLSYMIGGHTSANEKNIFFVSGLDNNVIIYDPQKNNFEVRTIHKLSDKIISSCIYAETDHIWFALRGKEGICCMDITTGEVMIYDNYPEGFAIAKNNTAGSMDSQPFLYMFCIEEELFLLPTRSNMILKFNKTNKKFYPLYIFSNKETDNGKFTSYIPLCLNYFYDENYLYVFTAIHGVLKINLHISDDVSQFEFDFLQNEENCLIDYIIKHDSLNTNITCKFVGGEIWTRMKNIISQEN